MYTKYDQPLVLTTEDTIADENEARTLYTAFQQLGNDINQFARFSRASYQQRLTCCEMCGWVSTRGNSGMTILIHKRKCIETHINWMFLRLGSFQSDTYTFELLNRMLHDVERKTDELMSVLEHQFTDI